MIIAKRAQKRQCVRGERLLRRVRDFASAADARRMRDLGYRAALIGTALMARENPAELLREIIAATRTVRE